MGRQREKREDSVCEIKRESIREAPNADVRRFIDPKHAVLRVLVDAYGYGRLAVPNLEFSLLSALVNFSSSEKKKQKRKKRKRKNLFVLSCHGLSSFAQQATHGIVENCRIERSNRNSIHPWILLIY